MYSCESSAAPLLGCLRTVGFRVVLLLWEVLTPVFPVFQLFGKLKDRVNVMPSARVAGANRRRAFHRVSELGGRPLGRGNPRDSFPVIPLTSLSWPACGVSHPSEPAGLS